MVDHILQEYFWTSGISIIGSASLRFSSIHLHCGSGHCSCLVNYLTITVILIGLNHLLINTNKLFSAFTYCVYFAIKCNTVEVHCRPTY
jgi:hypothetical protein